MFSNDTKLLFYFFLIFRYLTIVEAVDKVIVGYWGYWESKQLPIDHIPWSQITHINYGFATVNEDILPVITSKAQLVKLVGVAHQNNVKALLSIGGWTGCKMMSKMASSKDNRTQFIEKVVGWVLEYGLDGIDIDWEYPGKTALECNMIDYANDADNYLLLLQELREALDRAFSTLLLASNVTNNSLIREANHEVRKLLTIAVGNTPFLKNNSPMRDMSNFAKVLDWIFIMMYDTYVGKSVIGPNAPLQSSTQIGASAQSFAQAWIAWSSAHMPSDKIVMGLPFYGYASKPREDVVKLKRLLVTAHASRPQGDADDELSVSPCPGAKRGYSGLWKWKSLKSSGVLMDAKTPGGQWIKNWDQESQTPWLYNPVTRHLISYDDPDSIALKVNFANCKNARGVGVWDLSFDSYTDRQGELLSVVNEYMFDNKSSQACQLLNPVPNYKVVGPNFNALTTEQVFSLGVKIICESQVKYLVLVSIIFCFM